MQELLDVFAPVFTLIGAGYLAARGGLIGPAGAKGLNDFVLYFCVPPLLFRTMQKVGFEGNSPFGLWSAYYAAVAIVWLIVALGVRRLPGLGAAGGAPVAFAATFGNLGIMGLSIAYLAYGDAGLLIAALIIALHAANHWFFATVWAELALRQRGVDIFSVAQDVVVSLLKNPVVVALLVGAGWNASGLVVPAVAERVINLAGDAAIPAGLFALGLAIAAYPLRGNLAGIAVVIALKMLVFPVIAWTLAYYVFSLPPRETSMVALFAALPTGMNAYFFSVKFDAAVPVVTGAIALGVLLSVVTIPLLMWVTGAR